MVAMEMIGSANFINVPCHSHGNETRTKKKFQHLLTPPLQIVMCWNENFVKKISIEAKQA